MQLRASNSCKLQTQATIKQTNAVEVPTQYRKQQVRSSCKLRSLLSISSPLWSETSWVMTKFNPQGLVDGITNHSVRWPSSGVKLKAKHIKCVGPISVAIQVSVPPSELSSLAIKPSAPRRWSVVSGESARCGSARHYHRHTALE